MQLLLQYRWMFPPCSLCKCMSPKGYQCFHHSNPLLLTYLFKVHILCSRHPTLMWGGIYASSECPCIEYTQGRFNVYTCYWVIMIRWGQSRRIYTICSRCSLHSVCWGRRLTLVVGDLYIESRCICCTCVPFMVFFFSFW